jgi:hypothetical protein
VRPTGIIFAGLDCDADAIEQWNRWYDLEHVPPNVSMRGVMLGRRYVAPPALHALRRVDPTSGFADGRGLFLTLYTLCLSPDVVFAEMTTLRDKLYAENRMNFPAEKKMVREGDVLTLKWAVSAPELLLPVEDVPFLGHTSLLVVQRRGSDAVKAWYRDDWAPRVAALDGIHGVMSVTSVNRPGLDVDLVFVEGDPVAQTGAIRGAAPHHVDAEVVLDTPFLLIQPLLYPWADEIRASDLPQTVA